MFVDIHQQIALVQAYIAHRKNVEIEVNLNQFHNNPINVMLLQKAYNEAHIWFRDNKGTVNLIK